VSTAGAIDRVVRRCAEHDDERPLRAALVEELARVLPFGGHVFALTDPETEVGTSPLATVPDRFMEHLPGLIRRRYLTTVNRWDRIHGPADSVRRATSGRVDESLLFREALGPLGVVDVASVVFRDRFGCWGWLDLWRLEGADPFADGELDLLAGVAPPITEGLRRCQARSFDDPQPAPPRSGPAVLVLSPTLEVRAQTPETDAFLRTLLPTEAGHRPVPAGAYNVAAQLLANEVGIDDRPPLARVRLVGGVWMTFRAARVETDAPREGQDIAVTIEPTSPAERLLLYCRSHGLSDRETELLGLLVDGRDTKTVASAMFISEHTVQDHLKSIFDKTGARNRRTLLSRVTGH
jgi:DNA-binding CsgD family transcriptional regulator